MSTSSPNNKAEETGGANGTGQVKSTRGLSLVADQWNTLRNPVLKLMHLHETSSATNATNATTAVKKSPAHLDIINIPSPRQLQFTLSYRGTALRATVSVGQQLERGDSLTEQLPTNPKNALPPILSPTTAVVKSIERTACKKYTKVILSVTHSDKNVNQDLQHNTTSGNSTNNKTSSAQASALPWYCEQWKLLSWEQRWRAVRDSSIRGHGGGGFLLADKANRTIETMIINAVECEPLISCDAALINHHSAEVLLGIISIMELSDCRRCIIAFETGDEWQAELLQKAISDLQRQYENPQEQQTIQRLCDRLSVLMVPAVYPQGAERILIETVTGIKLRENELPGDHNICCTNVATCHALYHLGHKGHPPTQRIMTMTGDAMYESVWGTPVNIQTVYGTPLNTLLETAGIDAGKVRIQLGGPVCGVQIDSLDHAVDASSNCLVISKSQTIEQTDNCIRCGNCADACPASLLPQQLHLAISSGNRSLAKTYNLSACLECGCCDLVCPSNIPLTAQFRDARKIADEEKIKADNAALALERYEARKIRLEKREAERRELRQQRKLNTDDKALKKKKIAEALARARKKN